MTDDDTTGIPSPSPKPKAVLTFKELAKEDDEGTVSSEDEIPNFLYPPGTRSNEAAKIMVFEGIRDTKTINKRTGLTVKTIANIRSSVRKLAESVVKAQEQEERKSTGKPREKDMHGKKEDDGQSEIHCLQKGTEETSSSRVPSSSRHEGTPDSGITAPKESPETKKITESV